MITFTHTSGTLINGNQSVINATGTLLRIHDLCDICVISNKRHVDFLSEWVDLYNIPVPHISLGDTCCGTTHPSCTLSPMSDINPSSCLFVFLLLLIRALSYTICIVVGPKCLNWHPNQYSSSLPLH